MHPRRLISGDLVPSFFVACDQLEVLSISGIDLVGSLPPTLGNLRRLRRLNLSRNLLHGQVPAELGACTHLQELRLSPNRLRGELPKALGGLHMLRVLELDIAVTGHDDLRARLRTALADEAPSHESAPAGQPSLVPSVRSPAPAPSPRQMINAGGRAGEATRLKRTSTTVGLQSPRAADARAVSEHI